MEWGYDIPRSGLMLYGIGKALPSGTNAAEIRCTNAPWVVQGAFSLRIFPGIAMSLYIL